MKKAEDRMQNLPKARSSAGSFHSAFFLRPSLAGRILILLVRVYRLTLSPAKTFLFGPAAQCRFEPSCSHYAIKAVETHGAFAGGWLAAKRICRCHPWGQCGEDPVPPVKPKVQNPKPQGPPPELRTSSFGFRI
jgi:putative membrane protein insertion efficiency factor